MALLEPGSHGSTFGGNPLAAAVGLEALNVLEEEALADNSADLGELLLAGLRRLNCPGVVEARGRGLLVGLELDPSRLSARSVSEALMKRGILARETHQTVLRLAPPLVITRPDIEHTLTELGTVLEQLCQG
jgi:ornithine--oxo-acid transaminase